MADDKTTDIVKYNPGAPLQSPRMMVQFGEQQRPMEMVSNAIEGEMSDGARERKAKAILEEAYIHIATADPDKTRPKLLSCTQESAIQCLAALARCGLSLNRAFDEAYLIPFKNVMTLMASWKGMVKLAVNTGLVRSVEAHVVYEGDEFDPKLGTERTITHHPKGLHPGNPEFVIAAYAVIEMTAGKDLLEVIWKEELDKIRGASKAKMSPAYTQWATEMQRKAVIKRALKRVAKSADDEACRKLAAAIEYDNEKFGLVERGQQVAQEHSKQLEAAVTESLAEPKGLPGAPPCSSCDKPLDHTGDDPLCTACRQLEPQQELFDTDGENVTDD